MNYPMSLQEKKITRFYLTIVFLAVFSPIRFSFAAEQIVQATVEPYVAVAAYERVSNIGSFEVGSRNLTGNFTFFVESNTTNISLQVLVTPLHKDTNPSNTSLKPISVNTDRGVDISPQSAIPIHKHDLNARYISITDVNKPEGMYTGHRTEQVDLKSTQADSVFSQDITLSATWIHTERSKPAGVYGGYFVLYVLVPY